MPGEITINNGGQSYFGPALVTAVGNGQVAQSRLDDMATRILAGWYVSDCVREPLKLNAISRYFLGQDSGYPSTNLNANVQGTHKNIIRQLGAASIVLLKNSGNVLPLNNPASVAVIGA